MIIEKSCGAVLFTELQEKRYYVLVSSTVRNNCGLPKGHMEGNETEQETALREIFEETLIKAEIVEGFRKQIEYMMPNGNKKQVIYFMARYKNQEAKNNPNEKLNVLLLPIHEAVNALTFDNTKKVLSDADDWLSSKILI